MAEVEFIEAEQAFHESVAGWAFFPFQAEALPFHTVDGTSFHVVKTLVGEIRGNHLHRGVEEWLHIFGGDAIFYWQSIDGDIHRRNIDNEHTIIRIREGVPHAVSNPGPNVVYLVAFRTDQPDASLPVAEPAEIV